MLVYHQLPKYLWLPFSSLPCRLPKITSADWIQANAGNVPAVNALCLSLWLGIWISSTVGWYNPPCFLRCYAIGNDYSYSVWLTPLRCIHTQVELVPGINVSLRIILHIYPSSLACNHQERPHYNNSIDIIEHDQTRLVTRCPVLRIWYVLANVRI